MTQLERYAQMMKVSLEKVQAHIALSVGAEGSVLAQTIQARADKIAIHYEIESDETPERVAGLVRNARNGCYVRQTIGRPELFDDTITLNGHPLDIAGYPPPSQ
jgi:pentose-5-phosphate-3-epimerase